MLFLELIVDPNYLSNKSNSADAFIYLFIENNTYILSQFFTNSILMLIVKGNSFVYLKLTLKYSKPDSAQ